MCVYSPSMLASWRTLFLWLSFGGHLKGTRSERERARACGEDVSGTTMGNAAGVVDYENMQKPPPLTTPPIHRIHSSSLLITPPASPLPHDQVRPPSSLVVLLHVRTFFVSRTSKQSLTPSPPALLLLPISCRLLRMTGCWNQHQPRSQRPFARDAQRLRRRGRQRLGRDG